MSHYKPLNLTYLIALFLTGISAIYHLPLLADETLQIVPASISVKPGESVVFSAIGYTDEKLYWTTVQGDLKVMLRAKSGVAMGSGQLSVLEGTKVRYTAPYNPGIYSVAVTTNNAMAVAEVQVYNVEEAILMAEIRGQRVLTVGTTQALSLQVWLADLSQRDYTDRATWTSNNQSIVEVYNGSITALATGTATISASGIGDHSPIIEVEVQPETALGLVIEPSPVYLPIDGTQTLIITKLLQSSNTEKLLKPSDCEFSSQATNLVTINSKAELTANKTGYAVINVNCNGLTASTPVFVGSFSYPETDPETITLERGETKPYAIIGGMPPYVVTATTGRISGKGEHWNYHAARTIGDDTITITDQDGKEAFLNVTVVKGLELSPLQVDLAANTMTDFTVIGGIAPYSWRVLAGILDESTGDSISYTAPEVQGIYEITVIDNQNCTKTAIINVGAGLIATPNQFIINPIAKKRFQITGGTTPYIVSTSAGSYNQEEDGSYYYVAPSIAGDYSIAVKDAEGRSAIISVIVESSLQVTPQRLFLTRKEETKLNISGGYGNYTVTAQTGDVDENDGKLTYQAAKVAGHDIITVSDQAGTVVQIEVLVSIEGFYASPGESYVLANESVKLRGLGGTPPYSWQVLGEGSLSNTKGQRVTFTAPAVAGKYTVLVTDNTGKEVKSHVIVYQGELQLTPELLVLEPNQSADLHAILGVPKYTWWVEHGNLSATAGEKVTYTAPTESVDSDLIWLEDATGKIKSTRTVISRKIVRDIIDLYAGSDGKLDETDMSRAVTDYFQKKGWLNRTELFLLLERFLSKG